MMKLIFLFCCIGNSDERGEYGGERGGHEVEHDRNRGGGHERHISDERGESTDLNGRHKGDRHIGGHGELSHPQELPSRS